MKSSKIAAAAAVVVALVSMGCKQLTKDDFADAQKEAYGSLFTPENVRNERDLIARGWDDLKGSSYVGSLFNISAADTDMITAAEITAKVNEFNKNQKKNAAHNKFSGNKPYCEAKYNGKNQKKKMDLSDKDVEAQFAENFEIIIKGDISRS
ncbi:MAG: hypothetical protein ACTTKL_05290 [Treponema sp.]